MINANSVEARIRWDPFKRRDWYFIAEQPAPAPHLAHPEGCAALRIVLVTVPRVCRSCEPFPDGFDLHLLHNDQEIQQPTHASTLFLRHCIYHCVYTLHSTLPITQPRAPGIILHLLIHKTCSLRAPTLANASSYTCRACWAARAALILSPRVSQAFRQDASSALGRAR